ncbi:MAG: tellurite resistance TerB family protein [Gammaproteobacteria bacterium]|nr:tellurite resistance TerB family protein [Gammaproteobacteria bacterium]
MDAIKILGSILSSGALSRGSGSDILGSVIGAITGSGEAQGSGGLGSVIGEMLGGRGNTRGAPRDTGGTFGRPTAAGRASGGLGDLLGGLLGGGRSGGDSLGALLESAMAQFGGNQRGVQLQDFDSSDHLPRGVGYQQATDQATLIIRAMINAAKADGRIDREEQRKILAKLGDVTQDELDFIEQEMAQPLDIDGFVRAVPADMEQQIYAVSLMAIDLDSNAEAQYLHRLAQRMGLTPETCNALHEQLGAPSLYRQ